MRGSGGITGCDSRVASLGFIGVVEVAEDADYQHKNDERCNRQKGQRHHDEPYADFALLVAGSVRAVMYRVFHVVLITISVRVRALWRAANKYPGDHATPSSGRAFRFHDEISQPDAAQSDQRDQIGPINFQPALTKRRFHYPEYIQDPHDDDPDGQRAQPGGILLDEAQQEQEEGHEEMKIAMVHAM